MSSSGLTRLLLLFLIGAGAWALATGGRRGPDRDRSSEPGVDTDRPERVDGAPRADCPDGAAAECASPDAGSAPLAVPGPRLSPDEACRDAGYLCAALSRGDSVRIMRYPDDTGVLTVRVLEPAAADPARARRLHRAAIRGILAWQGHPFPIRIEERESDAPADLGVRWTAGLEGTMLGRTRSRFRTGPEGVDYRVVDLVLATRVPGAPERELAPATVELAAAHETGHALGLPHSDDPRDLMYPANTAARPTARDYRTLEAVYRVPNGARIVGPR